MIKTRNWMAAAILGAACAASPVQGELLTRIEEPIEPSNRPEARRTKGWTNNRLENQIRPDSGKRNPVFYVGEDVTFTLGEGAAEYEVRDYLGHLVDSGDAGEQITIGVTDPGWYKLYIYGSETSEEFGDVLGGTTFVILRNTPGFPDMPPKGTPGGNYPAEDQPMRGVLGIGPQRHNANAANPEESIKKLQINFDLDREYYLPFDPVRDRREMVAFPAGTKGKEDGVRQVVEAYKDVVTYWEPRNEPNFGASGAQFVEDELKAFHKAVKEADADAKVMGPGTVTIGPNNHGLYWIDAFLRAGGGEYIDAFSFHAYNALNGDIFMSRRTMDDLQAVLEKHGIGDMEKWQTEQGFFAALYGAYQPRLQGRWSMLEMMVFDQYNLPKERNHLWYDRSHGFWAFPTWWINDDGSLNPIGAMMRVFSEEQYGAPFLRKLDFGKDGDKLFIGNVYRGEDRTTVAIMNTGAGTRSLQVRIPGADSVRLTSPFGVESDIAVNDGVATIDVPEVPVYLRLAPDQDAEIVPINWGPNLARQEGVTARQVDESGQEVATTGLDKIHNGYYENWYHYQRPDTGSWKSDSGFPVIVEMTLAEPADVSRVAVFSHIPWQGNSTLVDYELQYDNGGEWVTIDHVVQPRKVIGVFTPPTRTTIDSYFSDQWIFEHQFDSVKTQKIRLVVHETTYGGGAGEKVVEAGGQTGPQVVTLREIEVYGAEPEATVQVAIENPNRYELFEQLPLQVTLANHGETDRTVTARPALPEGWTAEPAEVQVQLAAGQTEQTTFQLSPSDSLSDGTVALGVTLTDDQDQLIDQHEAELRVHAPITMTPVSISAVDPANQVLSARVVNTTSNPIEVELTITAEQAGNQKEAVQTATIEPAGETQIDLTLPDVDLTQGTWQVNYTARAGGMVVAAAQRLNIRPWMGVGPFPQAFNESFGPEEGIDPTATYAVQGTEEPQGWKLIPNEPSGLINLHRHFKPNSKVSAYAAIIVHSPEDRQALMTAGSDDGVKIWINGTQILARDVGRGAKPDDERANVNLKAGDNEVLIRVTQGGGQWGFYFDLVNLVGEPMHDLEWKSIK